MKKTLLLTLALTTALSAESGIKSGFYVGAQAGVSNMSGSSDFKYSDDTENPGKMKDMYKSNASLSKTSPSGGVFAGYAIKSGNLYGALEAFAQFDKLSDKKELTVNGSDKPWKIETTSTGAMGGALHLGFAPNNNCVVYAILGVEARKFKVSAEDTNANISGVKNKINKKYTSVAFTPGVGARFAINDSLSIRAEYKCAMHKAKTFTNSGVNSRDPDEKTRISVKSSPVVHSFNVGIVYSF